MAAESLYPNIRRADVGSLAEMLVAEWLKQQGWQILVHRWHCRWGELDLVAVDQEQPCLAFVEVKARSRGNWDANGLLAITPAKREKLRLAAELFLATHTELAELPCRFDVAIVSCQPKSALPTQAHPLSKQQTGLNPIELEHIQLEQPVSIGAYRLTLQHYLPAAFEYSG